MRAHHEATLIKRREFFSNFGNKKQRLLELDGFPENPSLSLPSPGERKATSQMVISMLEPGGGLASKEIPAELR